MKKTKVESYKDQVQRKYGGGDIKRFGDAGFIQQTPTTSQPSTDPDWRSDLPSIGSSVITPTPVHKKRVKRQATGTGKRGGKSGSRNRRKAAPRGAKGIQSARIPRTKIG